MKKYYLLFIVLLFCQGVLAEEPDAYDLGITPNSYLTTKNTVNYRVKNNQFNISHLLISDDKDFDLFLKHAAKFRHIDSLSIGREGNLCKLVYELENKVLERMPNLPDLPNLEFLSVMIISMKYPADNIGEFKKLKFLELAGDFEQIPENIWELERLETLHLSAYFTKVSPKVYQLPKERGINKCVFCRSLFLRLV
jgi:hypothetical protein